MTFSSSRVLLKVSQVPDWERRAIRLSLGLVFFTTLGLTLWAVPEQYREEWGDEVVQSCNWAGATCAVVAASPLIGKVAQLSYERTLGTLTGGMLGFLVYDYGIMLLPDGWDQVFMVACAALVGFVSCWLSNRYKLDASMRLFVITFLIVTFGAHSKDSKSALGVALLRTGGIVCGVLLFMGLTIIVLPKSATIESLRELKNGLKLLTELNTLVWTSKLEAAEQLKQAAAKARAEEAAAAAAAASAAAPSAAAAAAAEGWEVLPPGTAAAGASQLRSTQKGWFSGLFGRWSWWRSSSGEKNGYVPLPDSDPEAGMLPAAAAPLQAGSAQPAAAGEAMQTAAAAAVGDGQKPVCKSSNGRVSQLTQALQHSTASSAAGAFSNAPSPIPIEHSELLLSGLNLPKSAAIQQQQQQQQQGRVAGSPFAASGVGATAASGAAAAAAAGGSAYEKIMEQYEIKCEAVLTSVYQSMFKVKEHIALADSEVYLHHAWGHYVFIPLFFNRAFINWLLPRRWRLPTALLEELATSVRVMARLLWTVHLDYSQGFDEVLSALPPGSNMGDLLLQLGQGMSAALGVLVEAFPNKNSILIDNFKQLDDLVDRILDISEASHAQLIQDLAANRPPVRPVRAGSIPTSPAAAAAVAAAGLSRSVFAPAGAADANAALHARLLTPSVAQLQRPGAAAVAAADAAPLSPLFWRTTSTAGPAAAAGAAGNAGLHVQQLLAAPLPPSRQVAFVTFCGSDGQMIGSSGQHPMEAAAYTAAAAAAARPAQLYDSLTLEGLSAPIRAESPQLLSPPPPQQQQQQQRGPLVTSSPAFQAQITAAAAAGPAHADSQGDLIFDVSDLPEGAKAAAEPAAAAGAAAGHKGTPDLQRYLSAAGAAVEPAAAAAAATGSAGLGSSLIRSKMTPLAVMAAVKLQRAGAGAAHRQNSCILPGSAGRAAVDRQASVAAGSALAAAVAAMTPQQQQAARDLMRNLSTVSAPDPTTAEAAAQLLEVQQQAGSGSRAAAEPAAAAAAAASGAAAAAAAAASMHESMTFVMLTRWYSFQFLLDELIQEMDNLYCLVQKVLSSLPHGL